MEEYNKWANEMNVGAYYVPPPPPANGHYFDASVYTKSKKQRELSIMKRLLKLINFFSVHSQQCAQGRNLHPFTK
jgi:hypothetical protein